jgi:hypothetical protein
MKVHEDRTTAIAMSVAALALLAPLASCSQAEDPAAGDNATPTPAATTEVQADLHDRPSAPAIGVAWDPQPTGDSAPSVLTGTVRNSTRRDRPVSLQVVGIDPHGDVVVRPIATLLVPAKGSASFSVPVADLPVQSVGIDSRVSLLATYEQSAPLPNGEASTFKVQAHSAPLHVTFDDVMARAIVRTTADQARFNGARFGSVIPKVTRLRHFNANLGTMQEGSIMRSALSAGGDPPPVTMVSDVGPGRPPGTSFPPASK